MTSHSSRNVKSVTIDRYDKIKDKLKNHKVTDYASENIEEMATDVLDDYEQLHEAELCEHKLTRFMLENIMEAANEDFKCTFRATMEKLETHLLKVRHSSYKDAHKDMVKEGLDVPSILKKARSQYRKMHDAGKWPAASHAKDSKAMNRNYGSVNMANQDTLQKMANALVKQLQQGDNKKFKNNGKGPRKGKPHNSRDKSNRNNPGRRDSKRKQDRNPALTTPPKTGENETKFIDGTKRFWCEKCGRWTLSHTSDQHKSKEELQAQNKTAGMARLNFDMHPAAFIAKFNPKPHIKAPANYWFNKGITLFTLIPFVLQLGILIIANQAAIASFVTDTWLSSVTLGNAVWTWLTMIGFIASDIGMNLLTASQHEFVNTSWMTVIAIIVSGIIGFGSGVHLYNKIPDEPTEHVRYRNGQNHRKKFKRAFKMPKPSRRFQRREPMRVTSARLNTSFVHHPRLAHVGRHLRNEIPKTE